MAFRCEHESIGHNGGDCCEVCRLNAELDTTRARLAEMTAKGESLCWAQGNTLMALAASQAECAELRAALGKAALSGYCATSGKIACPMCGRHPDEAHDDSCSIGVALSRAPGGTEALRAHTARAITETAREIARRIEALYQFMEKQPGDLTGNRLADEVETMILTDYTDADDPDFKRLVARLLAADAACGDAMKGADK